MYEISSKLLVCDIKSRKDSNLVRFHKVLEKMLKDI